MEFFIINASKTGKSNGFLNFLFFLGLFSIIFHVINALNHEEKTKLSLKQCIFMEPYQEIGFNTLSSMSSTYPSTIWAKSSESYVWSQGVPIHSAVGYEFANIGTCYRKRFYFHSYFMIFELKCNKSKRCNLVHTVFPIMKVTAVLNFTKSYQSFKKQIWKTLKLHL